MHCHTNAEDHLKVVMRNDQGDLLACYHDICVALEKIETNLSRRGAKWQHDERFGFLTTCPSNLGTAMGITVQVRLTHVCLRPDFNGICEKLWLDATPLTTAQV